MRHLLDTHTLLWYTLGNPKLTGTAKAAILDPANAILISPASYWELAIKVSIGKLTLHQSFEDFIDACLKKYAFTILPIDPKHISTLITLPFHHKDPFDRLLIAQALAEGITVIGGDPLFDSYGVTRIW